MSNNNKTDISLPLIGMNQDLHPDNLESKGYPFALNATLEDFNGNGFPTLQNEASSVLAVNFPAGFEVIGFVSVPEQNRTVYMLVNPKTGDSQIGEVIGCNYDDNIQDRPVLYECDGCVLTENNILTPLEETIQVPYCTYRTINDTPCLGFDINHPIDIEYRITDCNLNIYFTDALNQRRYLYFDYMNNNPRDGLIINNQFLEITSFSSGDCVQPVYGTNIDCNKIAYNPNYPMPCLQLVDVLSGGSLKAGVYQFLLAYADGDGNPLTQYFPATNPIPVFTRFITIETNYQTDKSIELTINNIDTTGLYSFYNVVVAETIDNLTQFKLAGTFPISRNRVTYTGDDPTLQVLSSDDVIFQKTFYNTAKSVTSANNYLLFAGVAEYSQPNFQRVALDVKLYWETVAIPEEVYFDPRNANLFRSYLRDEVYPLGIIFELTEGADSCACHIPGPSAEYYQSQLGINVREIISNNDVLVDTSCADITRNQNWQVYNLAQVSGTPHLITPDCQNIQCWEWGDFAYWESILTYPNDPVVWGELCGQPIRYHKFPDSCVTHIHDSLGGTKGFTDKNIVFPIGIKVDPTSVTAALANAVTNGIITQDEANRVKGYRIVRGNRVGHKSIVGKGLLYDVWSYEKFNRTYYYSNYPFNDLNPDFLIAPSGDTYSEPNSSIVSHANIYTNTGRYEFISPDTSFVNPTLGTELKLETEEFGKSEGYWNECLEQPKYKFASGAAFILALAAGVAAAFTANSGATKQCTTYTVRSDSKETQASNGFDYVGTGGAAVNSFTSGTGDVNTQINATKEDTNIGEIRKAYDNPYMITDPTGLQPVGSFLTPYNQTTGQQDTINYPTGLTGVEEWTNTTCTGSQYQNLNNPDLIPGLWSILTGALGLGLPSVQGLYYQFSVGLREMQVVLDFIISLLPLINFATQYQAIGNYNNYLCVLNNTGNKLRGLDVTAYLRPEVQLINEAINALATEFTTIYFNNWQRESAVYVKTDHTKPFFPATTNTDDSRHIMSDVTNYDGINTRFNFEIASYYASMRNFIPDQYGDVFEVNYLETDPCSFNINGVYDECETHVFGGDTFINRFAIKKKTPFFLQTRFLQPNQSDVRYQDLGNLGFPNFYFNTPTGLMGNIDSGTPTLSTYLNPLNIPQLLGAAWKRFDVNSDGTGDTTNTNGIQFFYQRGRFYLYYYGIPYFLVESDINLDYRTGQDEAAKDFFPHQQDLDFWLQEKNVPPSEDNYYFYNTTYSKQNKESFICIEPPTFIPDEECKTNFPNRVIYSDQVVNYKTFDNWLVFKANNFYDFPLSNGELISADGIENDKVLVRFQNTSQVFAAYNLLQTSADAVQVSTGGLFQSRPQEFSNSKLGYAGTQNRDLIQTEYGHVWADAKRGQIFNLLPNASGLDEISNKGMKNWFRENLPFQIFKDFPVMDDADIDNNFKGIGLHMCFDKRFNRFFITKLDYKVLDKAIQYDDVAKQFFYRDSQGDKIIVSVKDTRYFCNKSWTVSYNFFTKSWVSYHSFHPNFYVENIEQFESGYNDNPISTLESHNITNKSYQVYKGVLHPFIVETTSQPTVNQNVVKSFDYTLDVLRYQNDFDWVYNRDITFNKAIVYNQRQCSGLLELVVKNPDDLSQTGVYPQVVDNKIQIQVTNNENRWSFNEFYDTVISQQNNVPIFLYNCSNTNRILNTKALDYYKPEFNRARIRSEYSRVRMINDKYSSYKFIYRFIQNNQTESKS